MKKTFRKFLSFALCAAFSFTLFTDSVNAADREESSQPEISAESAIVIEAESGRVVYEKNAYEKRPMASTTKIMSALIALEQENIDEYFTVDSEAIKVEGSSMGLSEGDKVTLRTLCYGMMLPSGNDAANAAAVKIAGSIENFAVLMNNKARELGLENTNFVTPSGLDDYTDEHYSTAYDMAKLAAYAMQNDQFREICSQSSAKVTFGNPPYDRWLTNNNKLLKMCEGVVGVKTGFTDKARRCLVSACERNGVTLICVTLNAPDDWNDHASLYDYGFSKVKNYALPCEFGELTVNVVGGERDTVTVDMTETPSAPLFSDELSRVRTEVILYSFYYAPVVSGEQLGTVNFYVDGRLVESTPLAATRAVEIKKTGEKSTVSKMLEKIKGFLF